MNRDPTNATSVRSGKSNLHLGGWLPPESGLALLLLMALLAAIAAVTEVSSRQTISGLLSEYERELARRSFNDVPISSANDDASAPPLSLSPASDFAEAQSKLDALQRVIRQQGEKEAQLSSAWTLITTFRRRLQRLETTGASDNDVTADALMEQFIEERQHREESNKVSDAILDVEGTTLSMLNDVSESGVATSQAKSTFYPHTSLVAAMARVDASLALLGTRNAKQISSVATSLRAATLKFIASLQDLDQANFARSVGATKVEQPELTGTAAPAPAAVGNATGPTPRGAPLPTANIDGGNELLGARAAGHEVMQKTAELRSELVATPSQQGELTPWTSLEQGLHFVTLARTTTLLAVAVVLCGMIGSIIAALRAPRHLGMVSPTLGLAAGFVAFLAVRGGKAVLLAEAAGEAPMLNPYSFAFVGLLAGLFTERGYALLTYLVDQLVARVKAAMEAQEHSRGDPGTREKPAGVGAATPAPAPSTPDVPLTVGGQKPLSGVSMNGSQPAPGAETPANPNGH